MTRAGPRGPSPGGRPAAATLVVAAATLWGTAGVAHQLGPDGINPVAVGSLRSVLGGLLLVGFLVLLGRGRELQVVVQDGPGRAVGAATAIAVFQLGYFAAVQRAGVAVGVLVAIGSAPVITGFLDATMGRRPSRRWAGATVCTLTGAALLLLPGAQDRVDPQGVLLAVLAGAGYATYTVVSKTLLERQHPPTAVATVTIGGSGLILAPLLLWVDVRWVASPRGATVLAWLSVATIALAYALFNRGLRGLPPATVTTLTLAEPLTAALLAMAILQERLVGPALAGALLVAVGLLVIALPAGGRRQDVHR